MTMIESGYYPAGAEFSPGAPWNQPDPEPVSRDVCYQCSLQRTASVETDNYASVSYEVDEDGFASADYDFSGVDWLSEFRRQHLTPERLIGLLREVAETLAEGKSPGHSAKYWRRVADDCSGWTADDEYAEEEDEA